MLWCALWEIVDGVCEKRELIEKLLDRRGDREQTAGRGLLFVPSYSSIGFVG